MPSTRCHPLPTSSPGLSTHARSTCRRRLASPPYDVLLALHFDEPRDGALELENPVAAGVELLRQRGGGADEIAARLVERVDEDVEALGLVALVRAEPGDGLDDEGVEIAAERDIVRRPQRPAAELRHGAPRHALLGARPDAPAHL